MFDIFAILPKVFRTSQLILEVLKGGMTPEKLNVIVDELYGILTSIPQLQGFLAILQVLVKVVKVIIPALPMNPQIAKLLDDGGVTTEEIDAAAVVLEILEELEKKALADADVISAKIAAMPDKDILDQV